MKLACVTMVWRDYWLLERWIAHHSQYAPRSALYVINHGDDPKVAEIARGCNVLSVPRDSLPLDLTRRRWDLLGGLTNGLLAFYDRVICTDVDEFVVYVGTAKDLPTHLAARESAVDALSPVGLNVIPTETDRDEGPVLARHPNAMVSAKYTKPCIAAGRVVYTIGGHGLQRGSFEIDPEILLVHLHYVTPDYAARMAARQEIVAQSKSQNETRADKIDVPKRYWINWSDPAYIRDKELGLFGAAEMMDVETGFGAAALHLGEAVMRRGQRMVVDPSITKTSPRRIVFPKALQGAIEDRL